MHLSPVETAFNMQLPPTSDADLQTEVVEVVKAAKKLVDLVGADYVVSVGRGISSDVEGGIKIAEELAEVSMRATPFRLSFLSYFSK